MHDGFRHIIHSCSASHTIDLSMRKTHELQSMTNMLFQKNTVLISGEENVLATAFRGFNIPLIGEAVCILCDGHRHNMISSECKVRREYRQVSQMRRIHDD